MAWYRLMSWRILQIETSLEGNFIVAFSQRSTGEVCFLFAIKINLLGQICIDLLIIELTGLHFLCKLMINYMDAHKR